MIFRKSKNTTPDATDTDAATMLVNRPAASTRLPWPARDASLHETRLIPRQGEEEPATMLVGAYGAAEKENDAAAKASDDPVAGWLVVIKGSGRGRSLEIGHGANSIGRNLGHKLRVDFGDEQISREHHAVLSYDPRASRFYIQHGGGRNLSYVNDAPVLSPLELTGGEDILLGETTLRFVPFCGAGFSWAN